MRGDIMNKKLLAGVAALGVIAGGGSVTAVVAVGVPAAAASTTAVASSTPKATGCGPLESLVANGTITHMQAMDIHDGFVSYVHTHWRGVIDTVLGQQVKNHTITKAQAGAVSSAIIKWVQKYRGEESGHHGPCHHDGD